MENKLTLYFAVGIGGVVGSVLRYLISILFTFHTDMLFPWQTLIVNLIGSFLLAYIISHKSIREKLHPVIFTALATGVIGSFTTLSTVTFEIFTLWQEHVIIAVLYSCSTVFGGLFFSFFGFKLAEYRERRVN